MTRRPRVLFVTLGGTISSVPDEWGLNAPVYTAADLLASMPSIDNLVDIVAVDTRRIPSRAIAPADMCSLAHEIYTGIKQGCDGVVVTHGTDTMEETAYALALQLNVDVPIVLTGSMRLAHEAGADGPANLAAALRVAITPEAATLGAIIVMHDEIHAARWATKVHTSRVASFSSPSFGPVGYVVEGRVHLHAHYTAYDYLGMPDEFEKRVELIWVAAGADGLLVDAAASSAQGLVIGGMGGGHVPPAMVGSLRAAVESGLPVVPASRCQSGPVLEHTYGGAGSETHLREIGLHLAGTLPPVKARLRLLTALALDKDVAEVFPV